MQQFKKLALPDLVDMLSHHTARYMAILSEGGSMKEYYVCRLIIQFLQKEIEFRKKKDTRPSDES